MRNPTRIGVADILAGSIILDDEDRRAVAAVQRILAEYEDRLIATGLTARQLIIIDRMRHYRQQLDFINQRPPALPPAELANALTTHELEDFARWAFAQGFRVGIKAMRPGITDAQINEPYLPDFFYSNMLEDWRAHRQEEERAQ